MHVKIYAFLDPDSYEARYVGKTRLRWVSNRLAHHRDSARGYTRAVGCSAWLRDLIDKGRNPKIVILEEVDETDWVEGERFWIGYLRSLGAELLNRSDGGDGAKGYVPSL